VLKTAHIDYNGRYCMSSAAAAGNRAFGVDRGMPFPVSDLAEAEVILVVGSNPLETLPPIVQWFEKQKANGGKLITIDPRRTKTANASDLFLQITQGSDLAFANGLLYLAIEERKIDADFIAKRTANWELARRVALTYYPARVERLTGISEPQLRQTMRLLSDHQRVMVLTGRGPEQQSKGVDSVLAFINVLLALGKFGTPGSGYACLTGQGNGQGGREHGQKADQLPGYRLIENPEHREALAKVWGVEASSLPRKGRSAFELLDSLGRPDGIRGLLVMGSNVAVASPDSGRIVNRLKSLDFLAVCDAFPNETSATADVILPTLQWAEEEGTMTNFEGRVLHRRVIAEPPPGCKSDLEILQELARRMGHEEKFNFNSTRELFDEFRRATAGGTADYSGMTYERIDAAGGLFWPCPAEGHPGSPRLFQDRFHHPDGRARFHGVEHRPAGEEPDGDYPLFFITGRYLEHYNSGVQTHLLTPLESRKDLPRVQLHPRLATQKGITTDSIIIVQSRRASVEFAVEITPIVRPDTLFAPFHWGGRLAANLLTNPVLDPISRMPEFKHAAVKIAGVLEKPR
jgi:assimilatory nitrate reductase catalytic subunit